MAYFDRFGKAWAASGIVDPPTDLQSDAGFAFLGDNEPTVEQFNALFQDLDRKDGWLFAALASVMRRGGSEPTEARPAALLDALRVLKSVPVGHLPWGVVVAP